MIFAIRCLFLLKRRGKIIQRWSKITRRLGKSAKRLGKITQRWGLITQRRGKIIRCLGKRIQYLGKITQRWGRITRCLGKNTRRWGRIVKILGTKRENYLPVPNVFQIVAVLLQDLSFPRRRETTFGRANLIIVRTLCMRFPPARK